MFISKKGQIDWKLFLEVGGGGGQMSSLPTLLWRLDIAKHITVVTFSVLVHQMCVLNTKKLVFAYSFSVFEKTS